MVYKGWSPKRDERMGLANRTNGTPMKPDYYRDEYEQTPTASLSSMRSKSPVAQSPTVPPHWQKMGMTQDKWNDSARRAQSQLAQDRANFNAMVQRARDGQQNLAVTGDSIGSPTNFSTGVMADRTNAAGTALQRLRDPNGFRNVQSSYVDPGAYATEQNLRINQARMAADRAQRTAQYDAGTAKYTNKKSADLNGNGIPDRDEGISEQFGKYGISSMSDLSQVNAQYNAYMRAFRQEQPSGQRAMSFDEFVKTKHDQYKQLPAYGAAPQSPGSQSTQQPQGDLQRIIQTGNAAARTAQQQRNQSPGMMARAQDAMDQGAAMRAAAAASARGMDPRAAAAETLQNIAAMRAQAAQHGMAMDRLVQTGVNDLARVDASNMGQVSLEELRQKGLAAQRQDARRMDLAKLKLESMREMQPLKQFHSSSIQKSLSEIRNDPALLRKYPTPEDQLAAAKQMANAETRLLASAQAAQVGLLGEVTGSETPTPAFRQFVDDSFLGDAHGNGESQPMTLGQIRETLPREVQGPATDDEVVNEYRQAKLGGPKATSESVGKILAANGRYVDTNTVQALIQRAQSKGEGWMEADKAFQDLFEGLSPNSWEFLATDWIQKLNEARLNPIVSPMNFMLDYYSGGTGSNQVPWRDQDNIDRAIGLGKEPIAVPDMPPAGKVTPLGILAGLRTEQQPTITPAMRERALVKLRKRSGS